MAPSNLRSRLCTLNSVQKTEVEWSTVPCSYTDEPTSADMLRIQFVFGRSTQHAIGTFANVCEGFLISEAGKFISICPSELCIEDMASIKQSHSICMIEDFIKTEFPEVKPSSIVDKVIELVQNSIGSPLPPDRVIDVKLIDGVVIVHHTNSYWSEKKLHYKMDSTRHGVCVMCLDDFDVELDGSRLPCLHAFHKNCLSQWLQISNTCPICRFNIHIKWVPWF